MDFCLPNDYHQNFSPRVDYEEGTRVDWRVKAWSLRRQSCVALALSLGKTKEES